MTTTTNNLVNVNNSVMNTIFADSKSAARQRINSANIRKDFASLDVWSALHNVNSRVKSYKVNGETYGAQSLRLVALLAEIGKKKFTASDIILFDFSDVFNAPQTTAETREELLAKTTERGTLCTIKRDKDTNLYYIVTLALFSHRFY